MSVNRKVGNAVERNYIKRKMRELFRLNQGMLDENHDIWVISRKKFDPEQSEIIEKLFVDTINRINHRK